MFKTLDPARDIRTQVSSVNEVIVLNGAVFTGTAAGETNIKRYVHWVSGTASGSLYQSLYSSNYLSASSVEILNITYGQSVSSSFYNNSLATNKVEKSKIYRLHAKMLLGDETHRFNISGTHRDELIFVHIKRQQMKDEIKKGTVTIAAMNSGSFTTVQNSVFSNVFTDGIAASRYEATERGDVGDLMSGGVIAGQVFYQAGIIALIPENFSNAFTGSVEGNAWSGSLSYNSLAISGNLESMLNGVRYRFEGMTFINQANLQSTYYFCRALNDEFNYSSNPTFVDSSQRVIPTSGSNNFQTRTYITKVGLLGENQELLAVASLSEPLRKSPESEVMVKVRLDN